MKKEIVLFLLIISTVYALSQPLTPDSYMVEMRDGNELAIDVYLPDTEYARPTILIQTPYNKFFLRYNLPLGVGTDLETSLYNFVVVDWRGFYGSSAAPAVSYDRGLDGYDIIDWIVQQEWSDGMVGTWGPSALGKIQFQTAKYQHPNHICAVPLVASPEFLYQSYFPNGVYRTEYVEQLDNLGYGMSETLLANPHYNAVWQYVENQNYYPDQIQIPCLMIGGWYDHATDEMLKYFDAICTESPDGISNQHRMIMGPWAHGGFGATQVGTSTQGELEFPEAEAYNDEKANQFFQYYLMGAEFDWLGANPKYAYFQMGDMEWKGSELWPPEDLVSKKFYCNNLSELTETPPTETSSSLPIFYDPRDPSPTVGSCTLTEELGQGPYDQSPVVESRFDILLFTSDVLTEPVKHIGKAKVKLFVSSDMLDTDFAVRLCDVYPDNRSMILRDNIFRMRFREGFTIADTVFMEDEVIYEIEIELANTAHTFLPGHRIRLDVSSSNYPRFNNNINDGGDMYVSGDTLVAKNNVYLEQSHASYVEFQVGNATQLEELSLNPEVIVFPNPIRANETLCINSSEVFSEVVIYNQTGSVVFKEKNLNQLQYYANISEFVQGIYFIEIKTQKGVRSEKLVVY